MRAGIQRLAAVMTTGFGMDPERAAEAASMPDEPIADEGVLKAMEELSESF